MKNFIAVSRAYFDAVASSALVQTQTAIAPVVKTYALINIRIRIFYYGDAVASSLSLAMMHHETADAGPVDLTIHAWDGAAAHAPLPAPWDVPGFQKDQGVTDGTFFGVYIGGEESLNFYDAETKTGYFWTQDARMLPDWSAGAPFRTILHWYFAHSGVQLVHGAVVGTDDGAVLITAKSGSGKSTTALSCVIDGMHYLSDDYAAIKLHDGVAAFSLYNSAKVTREGLALFPELADGVWNKGFADNEKAVLFMTHLFPTQVRHEAPLKAVLIPRITGGQTRVVPAGKVEALLAIAPTTLFQLPFAETDTLAIFRDILAHIPCFVLELGPDIRGVPKVIQDFLKGV